MKNALVTLACCALLGCLTDPDAVADSNPDAATGDGGGSAADGAQGETDAMVTPTPTTDATEPTTGDGMVTPDPTPDSGAAPPDAAPPEPDAAPPEPDAAPEPEEPFSFFVTSLRAMRELSGSEDGFGGDLGGLDGADGICQAIADTVGVGHKEWRAFLSVVRGPDGDPAHAIDRIGEGPWYDANHRLVAEDIAGLLHERPEGDHQSVDDLPNEFGEPLSILGDAHDIPTGSDRRGRLDRDRLESTCNDWTSSESIGADQVTCGHSFPRRGGRRRGAQWISDHQLRGCTPGVNLQQNGRGEGDCIGCSGGYGGIYCFALSP